MKPYQGLLKLQACPVKNHRWLADVLGQSRPHAVTQELDVLTEVGTADDCWELSKSASIKCKCGKPTRNSPVN